MEFSNGIVGGSDELVRNGIQSRGYVAGVTGWRINRAGDAEFNDVTIRGSLVASDGTDSVVITNTSNPRIQFFKSGVVLPAEIIGFRPGGTGDTGIQMESAGTAGHIQGIAQVDELGWRTFDAANSGEVFGFDYELDPELGWAHAESRGGVSTLRSDGASTWLSVLADGKVGTGTATTAISTGDTNIGSANNANTPVIADRAYLAIVQIDYFRVSTGALARMDMKLWNGAVGVGTQLGGTARIPMAGPLSTARRTLVGIFVWRAFATEVMANVNLSLATTDGTVGQNWTAEFNAGFSFTIHEIGNAANISNL